MQPQRIGLIGYGEVGKTFADGLKGKPGVTQSGAWDLKFAQPATREAELAHAHEAGVTAHASMQALCEASDLVISAVTASNTLAVAQEAAPFLKPGTLFLDLNSASPGTKRQCAALVEARGAQYVDAKAVSEKLGVASAIKMCRSVMIKGLEALVIESYATARQYGVEDHVLPTLAETFPQIDWPKQGAYFFMRVVQHGQRRAEEMRESANTVREAGFPPMMTTAITR